MKRNNLILIVVTISMFVVLLLGATYAYFASNTSTGNGLDMTITTDDNNIAFAATEGTLSMHVKAEDMLQSQTGSGDVLAAETIGEDNITITLATNTSTPIACTYNVYFQWNANQSYIKGTELVSGDEGYSRWYPEQNILNELTLELNLEDEDGTGSEGKNSFANEIQMTKVVTSTSKTKVVNGAFIVGSSSNSGSQEWVPTVRFYNLNKDQSALAGKTFGGKFTIEDVECNAMENLSESLIAKAESSVTASGVNEYTSSQDSTPYVIKQETVEHEGVTYNAGIRYEGKDPDNYVVFNEEEWRIIGFFEGSTIGLEPGKQYTKIIRNAPMYNKAWDCDNWNEQSSWCEGELEHDWANASLNKFLNEDYLNGNGQIIGNLSSSISIKSINSTAKSKIAKYNGNYSTWYLRGLTHEDHEVATVANWYLAERLTGGAGYRNGVLGDADETIQTAIALMYPSDYGYAAYGEGCTRETPLSKFGTIHWNPYEVSGCPVVDWLMLTVEYEWLLSPDLDNFSNAFYVGGMDSGYVYSSGYLAAPYLARPVLYLEASVQIAGGNGSKANPYKIS